MRHVLHRCKIGVLTIPEKTVPIYQLNCYVIDGTYTQDPRYCTVYDGSFVVSVLDNLMLSMRSVFSSLQAQGYQYH